MKCRIVYFTRTGNSRRIAEKIAVKTSCHTVELHDDVDWSGVKGYFKYIGYRFSKKPVNIALSEELGDYDQLVVVTPLWDAMPAPATEAFLKTVPADRVHLVTSASSSSVRKAEGFASVSCIAAKKENEDKVIEELADKLRAL